MEIKSGGGYVPLPPSLHKSGRRYGVVTTDIPAVPAPPWLVRLMVPSGGRRVAAPPEAWRQMFKGGGAQGARDSTLIRMAGYLLRRGLDPLLVLDICSFGTASGFSRRCPRHRSPKPSTRFAAVNCGKQLVVADGEGAAIVALAQERATPQRRSGPP